MKRTRSNAFILENEKAWEPAGEGVVRQILGYDGQVMLVKVKFEQGAVGTPHTHYHTQTTYVASGKFEFTVNGEKQSYRLATVFISTRMPNMDALVWKPVY